MRCLRCDELMFLGKLHGVLANICKNCRSVWLDRGELDMLRAGKRFTEEELIRQASREVKAEAERLVECKRMCPRCGGVLQEYNESGVKVDRCPTCKGMFFDYGELEHCMKDKPDESWLTRLWHAMRGDEE